MPDQYDSYFDSPSLGGFKPTDHLGSLVLFENIGQQETVKTSYGDSPAARCDVTCWDQQTGEVIEAPNSLIFGAAMAPTVARSAGRKLLGRIAQGMAGKPGQDPPTILQEASDADKAFAANYLNTRQTSQFAAPAAAPALSPQAAPPTPPVPPQAPANAPAPQAAPPAPPTPPVQAAAPPAPAQPAIDVSQLTPEQLAAILAQQK